jgi:sulfate adenylyltransferase
MRGNTPHGGRLINRVATSERRGSLEEKARSLPSLTLSRRSVQDLEMIAIGAFSPLEGFMTREDYLSVLHDMRLRDGTIWTVPITLPASSDQIRRFGDEDEIALQDEDGTILGMLKIEEIYTYDRELEAKSVYRTCSPEHPGVKYLYEQGEYLIGGKVILLNFTDHGPFERYWFTPAQTREIFRKYGWRSVVGFQTRNPIHRAHEYIIKCAMEIADGLFLNPLVGETKKGDVPAEVRMRCYEVLLDRYFPKDRVFIGVYGAAMRYAGPKEAVLHAIVRRNFGCTHFIVGRDHAGVGNFYGPFDAQRIFDEFDEEEIGITPLFFDFAFYCRRCAGMATVKTCPHSSEERLYLSGTRVRELLGVGELPPPEFTRPEVANILLKWWQTGREDRT